MSLRNTVYANLNSINIDFLVNFLMEIPSGLAFPKTLVNVTRFNRTFLYVTVTSTAFIFLLQLVVVQWFPGYNARCEETETKRHKIASWPESCRRQRNNEVDQKVWKAGFTVVRRKDRLLSGQCVGGDRGGTCPLEDAIKYCIVASWVVVTVWRAGTEG